MNGIVLVWIWTSRWASCIGCITWKPLRDNGNQGHNYCNWMQSLRKINEKCHNTWRLSKRFQMLWVYSSFRLIRQEGLACGITKTFSAPSKGGEVEPVCVRLLVSCICQCIHFHWGAVCLRAMCLFQVSHQSWCIRLPHQSVLVQQSHQSDTNPPLMRLASQEKHWHFALRPSLFPPDHAWWDPGSGEMLFHPDLGGMRVWIQMNGGLVGDREADVWDKDSAEQTSGRPWTARVNYVKHIV